LLTPAKVLLVRQDRLMFEGLVAILSDRPNLDVLGVASSAADAVEKSLLLQPDLVLMDMQLSDAEGWQVCERIRSRLPNVAVLFLSADTRDDAMERAVTAGAAGYLSTEVSTNELVDAINRLAEGELLVTAATLARLQRQGRGEDSETPTPAAPLSQPEREVLIRIAANLDNWAIAEQLGVEPAKVRALVRTVLEKLGAHSKAQAIDSARRAGLIDETAQART
jgi:DNA-binding NarL/FixJ family response regulator